MWRRISVFVISVTQIIVTLLYCFTSTTAELSYRLTAALSDFWGHSVDRQGNATIQNTVM